jgi:hypothetical protein
MTTEIQVEGVKRTHYGYEVDGFRCYRSDPMWAYNVDRMKGWDKKHTREEFIKKNMTRIKRITKKEKLYYSLAVLIEMGFEQEVIDMYDAKLVMEALTEDLDFLKDI